MAKKCLLVLVLAGVLAGGVFAQEAASGAKRKWYNSYAPGIREAKLLINGGVGINASIYQEGKTSGYSYPIEEPEFPPVPVSLPYISASVEYALPSIPIPLSVGGHFLVAGYDGEAENSRNGWTYKGTPMAFSARASYHFNYLRNLDVYAGLGLGWMIWKHETTGYINAFGNVVNSDDPAAIRTLYEFDFSGLYYEINIGARYFFLNNIGAYLEIQASPLTNLSLGLSVKL
ncbi:MAG: outer membrane beta-barrel protein [Spirochaetaceae bacterium]|jgi:hypothetical protein|nr:outer membrane beta-barrel protein [Spirochaetaceae bacterium]